MWFHEKQAETTFQSRRPNDSSSLSLHAPLQPEPGDTGPSKQHTEAPGFDLDYSQFLIPANSVVLREAKLVEVPSAPGLVWYVQSTAPRFD